MVPKDLGSPVFLGILIKSWKHVYFWKCIINPSGAKARMFLMDWVDIMAADDLAPFGARSSIAMVLTI